MNKGKGSRTLSVLCVTSFKVRSEKKSRHCILLLQVRSTHKMKASVQPYQLTFYLREKSRNGIHQLNS